MSWSTRAHPHAADVLIWLFPLVVSVLVLADVVLVLVVDALILLFLLRLVVPFPVIAVPIIFFIDSSVCRTRLARFRPI